MTNTTRIGGVEWTVDANTRPATNSLNEFDRQVGRTERRVGRASRSIAGSMSKLAIGVGAALLVTKLLEVQRGFDRLNAQLVTSTGTAENAALAFGELEKFAARTPYALEQSVKAFTKLVNYGLTPSEKAMESYGNTASAMGKDLMQMIEAVSDATTGEFERLKEFGIKAKNQGDTIRFTFQGTTKTIKNSAAEIESYLIGIGSNNFAGAMANQMATLDGAVSNLGDTWDQLFRTINEQGAGEAMAKSVGIASTAIKDLIFLIESGQLSGVMGVISNSWRAYFSQIAGDVSLFANFVISEFSAIEVMGKSVPKFIADAFFQFPANIKAAVQLATVEIMAFSEKAKLIALQLHNDMNPFADRTVGGFDDYEAAIASVERRQKEQINSILNERKKGIKTINEEREAVVRNTLEFKKNQEIKASQSGGILKTFKIDSGTQPPEDEKTGKTKAVNPFADVYGETEGSFATTISTQMMDANESLLEGLERQRELILEFQDLEYGDAEAHAANIASLDEAITREKTKQAREQAAAQVAANQLALSSSEGMFGDMASMLKDSGNEQSSAYKAMFALSKGFAVAQAAMNLGLAISNASAVTPWYASIPAMASVVANGAALASSISGATYSGREHGGSVIGGQTYEVGEKNKPEMLMIPGNNGKVFSNAEIKSAMSGGGGNGGNVSVNLYNAPAGTRVESRQDAVTGEMVIDMIVEQMGGANSQGRRALGANSNTTGVLNGRRRS